MPIPRTFWRVWMDEEVPARYEAFWQGFKDLHPMWTCVTVDSSALPWMRPHIRKIFDRCTTHAGRSDVVRYEVLYQYGGVYVDCDVECLRPFDDLTEDDTPFAGWEDSNMLCPTVIGCPPKHPAMGDLLKQLEPWFNARPYAPPNQSTGPHLFTAVWGHRQDVRRLPPDAFYPVHWAHKAQLGGPYPEVSYAVHHWDARWLPGGPPQRP